MEWSSSSVRRREIEKVRRLSRCLSAGSERAKGNIRVIDRSIIDPDQTLSRKTTTVLFLRCSSSGDKHGAHRDDFSTIDQRQKGQMDVYDWPIDDAIGIRKGRWMMNLSRAESNVKRRRTFFSDLWFHTEALFDRNRWHFTPSVTKLSLGRCIQ